MAQRNPSKITTDLLVDDPLVIGPGYRIDDGERRYIDNQIRGIQQHLVEALIRARHATYVLLSASSATVQPGDVVCDACVGSAEATVTKAVAAALTNAGAAFGVVIYGGAPGSYVLVALGGFLPPTITNLGNTSGFVRVNTTTARCERVASIGGSDYPVGTVGSTGQLAIAPFPRGAGGSGEANTASNVGTGVGVWKDKVGADLRFRSVLAGANVTVTLVGDDIVIASSGGGGGGTPGGSNTQVQFNNAGAFGGDAGLTYDSASDRLSVVGGLTLGTNAASTGIIRSPANQHFYWRNAANSADLFGIGYDNSNQLLVGDSSSGGAIFACGGAYDIQTSGSTTRISIAATGGSRLDLLASSAEIYGGTGAVHISNTSARSDTFTWDTDTYLFQGAAQWPHRWQIAQQTSDAATKLLTIRGQAPFATATGANRNPGNVRIEIPAAVAGGTAGWFELYNGVTQIARFGLGGTSDFLAFGNGTDPVAAAGRVRLHAFTNDIIAIRNQANTLDHVLMSVWHTGSNVHELQLGVGQIATTPIDYVTVFAKTRLRNTIDGTMAFEATKASGNISWNWQSTNEIKFAGGQTNWIQPNDTTDATFQDAYTWTITDEAVTWVTVEAWAIKSDGSATAVYIRRVRIKRDGGTVTVGTVKDVETDEDGLDGDVTITNTTSTGKVQIKGVAATTVKWQLIVTRYVRTTSP